MQNVRRIIPAAVLFALVIAGALVPRAYTQCIADDFYLVRHVWRVGFNNVEALAGSQVIGDYWYLWGTGVSSTVYRNNYPIHYGTNSGSGISGVLWNDMPSSVGTGTYRNDNLHYFDCGELHYTYSSGMSLYVAQPTIDQLPYNNSLWYFGPGTPPAVPLGFSGGYAYQYANLIFNKHCNSGDTCSGNATWSENPPSDYISVSSTGRLESTAAGTCQYDSAVRASLDGWGVNAVILVNSPKSVYSPLSEETNPWYGTPGGYINKKYWSITDSCPPAYSIESVAIRETFGTFSNPGVIVGWPDPPITSSSAFNFSEWIWYDSIGAQGSYNPPTVFTSSSSPYTYNTILKFASQQWFAGSQSSGAGIKFFDGHIYYYQDHGNSVK